jgi:hypothetical protein
VVVMRRSFPGFPLPALFAVGMLTGTLTAATTTWKGGGGNPNWSTSANWSNGVPSAGSDARFWTNAAIATALSNNVVAASITIQSLAYQHTNGASGPDAFHNTYISDGVTLCVSNALSTNALFVGSSLALVNARTLASVSGSNGTLQILATNGAVNVRQGGVQNFSGIASLNLSALRNCVIRAQKLLVAGDGTNGSTEKDRASGTLSLARNNQITLLGGSFPPALTVGRNSGNGGVGGSLVLGQTNLIRADSGIAVGLGRSSASSLRFGPAANSLAIFRDAAGTGRQATWLIGDSASVTYSGNTNSGVVDFSGGTVDAQVALLVVGRAVNDSKGLVGGSTEGWLAFDAGVINANTVVAGYQINSYSARAGGTLNIDGSARLQVNNSVLLGHFLAMDPTNGGSYARLNIGTRSGGGGVYVNGPIVTAPATNGLNDSGITVRNGGTLSARGAIGPLLNFDLANCALRLDFGAAPNPTNAACVATNLTVTAPVALNIDGTALSPGAFALFKYKALGGDGVAGFTSLNLPSGASGYLSNDVAGSAIYLVLTQSAPDTNVPPVVTPRLSGKPVYADYSNAGGGLKEPAPRADGFTHVDTPTLIQKLLAGHIKTYAFLVWSARTDWDDFRLEFLPAAQAAGIDVWLYLTPPTENSPPANYTPFAEDYYSWLTESAALAQKYPALKAVVIDDFNSNLGLFTPDYVRLITSAAHAIDSNLLFMVINYDLTKGWASPTSYVSPAFMKSYGPYCGAVILPYLNWATNADFSNEPLQLAHNSGIINGRLAQFLVNFPGGRPSAAGDYASVSQILTNAAGFPDAPYPFTFRVSGYPTAASPGFHQLQVLVDGNVVWSKDITASYGVQDVTTNLQAWIAGKTSATLTVRVYEQNGVSSYRILSSWILPGGPWTQTETGAFAGRSTYFPAQSNNVPMVVMIYDWMYKVGGDNTSNYVYNANVIARNAVAAGQAAGIVQFQMDKNPGSPLYPIIQQLYGQWAYTPRISSAALRAGGVSLSGSGGGPGIGYSLRSTDSLALPAADWDTAATGAFGGDGSFTNSAPDPGHSTRFFRLSVP